MFFIKNRFTFLQAVFLFLSLSLFSFQAQADTAQYFYDELGRLIQVVNNGTITNYDYDEVGNVASTINGSLSSTPSVTNVSPASLLTNVKTEVVFTGTNLLSAATITSSSGNISITNINITNNAITALMTATTAGADTLTITFRDSAQTTYQTVVTAISATIVMNPAFLLLPPNSSASVALSLNPPQQAPITIGIKSSDQSVATFPETITIPANGTVSVQIDTHLPGTAFVTSLNDVTFGQILSESQTSADNVMARPVSVLIEPAVQQPPPSVATSRIVSVLIEPAPQAPTSSVKAAPPVSVLIEPSAQSPGPSVKVAPIVSVQISQ